MIKYFTFDRALFLTIIIAMSIMLNKCGGWLDNSLVREHAADSLRNEAIEARKQEAVKAWEYQNDLQIARFKARQADSATRQAMASAQSKSAEIRQLYALLREPWPKDTASRLIISERCCDSAVVLADQLDGLWILDSLKDIAYMGQLDLATNRVDTLQAALARSEDRFDRLDSLTDKPRGSGWIGSEMAVGKTSQAGIYFKWQTPRGKEYKIGTGLQPGGPYISAGVGIKISFRKKR